MIRESFNEFHKKQCLMEIRKCVILCANCHRKIHNGYLDL